MIETIQQTLPKVESEYRKSYQSFANISTIW